jgi:hypothetical protein
MLRAMSKKNRKAKSSGNPVIPTSVAYKNAIERMILEFESTHQEDSYYTATGHGPVAPLISSGGHHDAAGKVGQPTTCRIIECGYCRTAVAGEPYIDDVGDSIVPDPECHPGWPVHVRLVPLLFLS